MFDGKLWAASVDVKGEGHNRKRNLRSVSATASTAMAAVAALITKLDSEAWQRQLWEEEDK
jgi:hypothetical protein